MKDQTAFSTRFARHKDELEWLFIYVRIFS